jgi:7-cyano-7-deazaguanine synthase
MNNKTILIYSGGLDSTVLLYHLIDSGQSVKCLSFNYGQRHKKEIESARYFCEKFDVEHDEIDLTALKKLLSSSCLTSDTEVPEGHYAEESMKSTVVPNRNMIMLSIGVAHAINSKFDNVAYAAHNGDHAIYPDCRESFVRPFSEAVRNADWHSVEILRPFVNYSKTQVVKIGESLGVEFAKTWSCYNGREFHCGKCGTCVERKEAFSESNVKDTTIYF